MQINDLKQDKRNYRKHNEKNLNLIKKSVNETGFGRSIVIDNENEIVCGNGLVSTLDKKTKIKVVETDGSELVVVKRTDLKTDDEKRKKLAVMDNSASDTSTFDNDLLQIDFSIPDLEAMGVNIKVKVPEEDKPEIEFTEELLEEHNYVVLYFDNSVDWLQIQSLLQLKTVKALADKKGFEKRGVGRVVNGAKALELLRKGLGEL